MLDETQLTTLERLNKNGGKQKAEEASLEDMVLALGNDGSLRLVGVSSSPDRSALFLVKGTQATELANDVLFRKKSNADGSWWITGAEMKPEVRHYSFQERHVLHIGPDGQTMSIKNRITKLGSGESVRLTEKMIFLAARGKPQPLE